MIGAQILGFLLMLLSMAVLIRIPGQIRDNLRYRVEGLWGAIALELALVVFVLLTGTVLFFAEK